MEDKPTIMDVNFSRLADHSCCCHCCKRREEVNTFLVLVREQTRTLGNSWQRTRTLHSTRSRQVFLLKCDRVFFECSFVESSTERG